MATLLHFEDERNPVLRLAAACSLPSACIESHRFPDDELRLRLPVNATGHLDSTLVIYRSLDRPNDKLVQLLLTVREARALRAQRILLVDPYLAYMRQDSSRWILTFIASAAWKKPFRSTTPLRSMARQPCRIALRSSLKHLC